MQGVRERGKGDGGFMVAIDLKSLVARMTELGRRQLEAAAGLTLSRTHYNVEIEHLLMKLIETPGSDVSMILKQAGIDVGRVLSELTRALDKMKTGNARAPGLSPDIVAWLREAWLIASLEANQGKIRTGHMLAALISDEVLARTVKDSAPTLLNIPTDALRKNLDALTKGSEEEAQASIAAPPGASGRAGRGRAPLRRAARTVLHGPDSARTQR
jgi:type VI secretion system protein VasG